MDMKGGDRNLFYVTALDLSWSDWANLQTAALSLANIWSAERKKNQELRKLTYCEQEAKSGD